MAKLNHGFGLVKVLPGKKLGRPGGSEGAVRGNFSRVSSRRRGTSVCCGSARGAEDPGITISRRVGVVVFRCFASELPYFCSDACFKRLMSILPI
jgi:hypothetical protein